MTEEFKPNCRYGHGDLVKIEYLNGIRVHFGYTMIDEKTPMQGTLAGMSLWVCKACGYNEMFDIDVRKTLALAGIKDV